MTQAFCRRKHRQDALNRVLRAFYRAGPVRYHQWDLFSDVAMQDKFLQEIAANRIYIPSTDYLHGYGRSLVKYLERHNFDVHENLYGLAAGPTIPSVDDTEYISRTHFLGEGMTHPLTLFESKKMISEGTTGLQTWEAAIVLSRWFINHPEKLKDRSVLELGAGTALCSITIAAYLQPKRVTITDHSRRALELCKRSLQFLRTQEQEPDREIQDFVETRHLDFADAVTLDPSIDTVIATDVTFDNLLVDALVATLKQNPHVRFYIVHTSRKQETSQYLITKFFSQFKHVSMDAILLDSSEGVCDEPATTCFLTNDEEYKSSKKP